MQQTKGSVPVI